MALVADAIAPQEAPPIYTLIGLDGRPTQVTEEQLASMDNATLLMLRERNKDEVSQKLLAPYEHRAFAREETQRNPLMAAPIALATPLYAGAKALGLIGSRTGPTLNQVGQGLTGVGEGLAGAARGFAKRLL